MSGFAEAVRKTLEAFGFELANPVQEVFVPNGVPGEGSCLGLYLRGRDGSWSWHETPREVHRVPAISALVTGHNLFDLRSMLIVPPNDIFLDAVPQIRAGFAGGRLAGLDAEHPEAGVTSVEIRRHASWVRWAAVFQAGTDMPIDLSHEELADLLQDNKEDLVDPMLARVVSQFRAAKTIEYDGDIDNAQTIGLRTTWKGASAGTGNVLLPREIVANVPAFDYGFLDAEQQAHEVRIRLRAIAPKGEGASPLFRLIWVNARDYEMEAISTLGACVKAALVTSGVHSRLYLGAPKCTRYHPFHPA